MVPLESLSPVEFRLIVMYISIICLVFLSLSFLLLVFKRMPHRFRWFAVVIFCCNLINYNWAMQLITNLFDPISCTWHKKGLYFMTYLIYAVFDFYQLYKIQTMTLITFKENKISLGFFALRIASYILAITQISGKVVPHPLDPSHETGNCLTVSSMFAIYQEHAISIIFELGLSIQFFRFIFKLRQLAPEHEQNLPALFKKFIDFETAGYIFYFVSEIVYLVVFSVVYAMGLHTSYLSMINGFYYTIPSALMSLNTLYFFRTSKSKGINIA